MKLTPRQAQKLGILQPEPPKPGSHEGIVATYSDAMLDALITDIGKRNLSDYRNHENRFLGQRMKAARAERRSRKQLTTSKP